MTRQPLTTEQFVLRLRWLTTVLIVAGLACLFAFLSAVTAALEAAP